MEMAQRNGVRSAQLIPERARARQGRSVVLGQPDTPAQLGEVLVAHHIITERQLGLALEHQRKTGRRLGDALLHLRFLSREELGALLEWLYLAEERRARAIPPAREEVGLLQRIAAAMRRAIARWRGGWIPPLVAPPSKVPSKARS